MHLAHHRCSSFAILSWKTTASWASRYSKTASMTSSSLLKWDFSSGKNKSQTVQDSVSKGHGAIVLSYKLSASAIATCAVWIDALSCSNRVPDWSVPQVPEKRGHHLANRCNLLELFRGWRPWMFPLFTLRLGFKIRMVNPCFILGHKSLEEIGWVSLKTIWKCSRNVQSFQLLVQGQHLGNPSCGQMLIPRIFIGQHSMNIANTDTHGVCNLLDCAVL